jgi:hypothetical protein
MFIIFWFTLRLLLITITILCWDFTALWTGWLISFALYNFRISGEVYISVVSLFVAWEDKNFTCLWNAPRKGRTLRTMRYRTWLRSFAVASEFPFHFLVQCFNCWSSRLLKENGIPRGKLDVSLDVRVLIALLVLFASIFITQNRTISASEAMRDLQNVVILIF